MFLCHHQHGLRSLIGGTGQETRDTLKLIKQRIHIVSEIDKKLAEEHSLIVDELSKKFEGKIKSLKERVNVLEEDNTAMASAVTAVQEENDSLKTEIMLLKSDMEMVKDDAMRNKQYA